MNNGLVVPLRRKRSKSAPDPVPPVAAGVGDAQAAEAPEAPEAPAAADVSEASPQGAVSSALVKEGEGLGVFEKDLADETPLELLRPSRTGDDSLLGRSKSENSPREVRELAEGEAHVFVHRTERCWVITPLGSSNIELRPRSDALPPPGCKGVIWRLDDQVLQSGVEESDEDFMQATQSSARVIARRLEKVSSGMRRLRDVTAKLEEKFTRFQEEKLELERRQKHLNKSLEDSAKDHAHLSAMRVQVQEEQKKFLEEKSRFDDEVRKNTDELAQSKRALATGHFAVLPPHVLFLAAQDEFVRALPELTVADKASYLTMAQAPEAAFSSACSLFNGGGTGAEALVSALLACQRMMEVQAPRVVQNLEQLLSLAQAVARSSNVDGRMRLSFAASSCALWCSLQLSDVLARKWDEVNAPVSQDLILEEQDFGLMYKRLKLMAQAGSALKRSQKSLGDYWDHRRRFIRCLAKPGGGTSSEADLRLLFLPFRDVRATELAAHVRRLSDVVEDLVVESATSSRKRGLVEAVALEAKRPKPSSRL